MEKLVQSLREINFTESEIQIYIYLLKNPGQTPFIVAKELHLNRSSIYQVMDEMVDAKKLVLEKNKKDLYYAEDPSVLLERSKKQFDSTFAYLMKELPQIKSETERQPYLNLVGYDEIIGKVRTMLYEAKDEVYMNTDLDLKLFDDSIGFLEKKGVDVFAFTFRESDYKRHNLHLFSHQYPIEKPSRIMLVVDQEQVLVANLHVERNEWMATYTRNALMIDIITEHIHHDIYLQMLRKKLGESIFILHPEISVGSKHERKGRKAFRNDAKE